MRKSARKALSLLAVTAILLIGTATAAEQNSTQQSDVNVTIASEVAVDLHPQQLDYGNAGVGSQVTSSDAGFSGVDLENVGSEYIDKIWVNATRPSSDPVGTGSASNYNAGNFFLLKPNNASGKLIGDSNNFNFVNRVEFSTYNRGEIPSYINAPADGNYNDSDGGTTQADNISVGRIRAGDEEYFYALPEDTNGLCDGTGSSAGQLDTLLIAKKPHTASNTHPIDFTEGNGFSDIPGKDYNVYVIDSNTGSSTYGIVDSVNLSTNEGESRNYDILTKCDTTSGTPEIIRTKYNIEAAGADDLSGLAEAGEASYLLQTSTGSQMLQPGEAVTFDVGVQVPRGVPAGQVTEGQLTVSVTADLSQDTS